MVAAAGIYRVDFIVSYTEGAGAAVAVAVNGEVRPGGVFPLLADAGQVFGAVILKLGDGDVITLRNQSKVTLILATAPSTGATIGITRLA